MLSLNVLNQNTINNNSPVLIRVKKGTLLKGEGRFFLFLESGDLILSIQENSLMKTWVNISGISVFVLGQNHKSYVRIIFEGDILYELQE